MAGKIELLTPSNGKVALVGEDTATDVTVTVPARTGNVAVDGPAFSAFVPDNTQTVVNSTFTKVQFSSEEFDLSGAYDNVTNYRFQPTVSGYYQINSAVGVLNHPTGIWLISIFKNGSRFKDGSIIPNSNQGPLSVASALIYFNGTTDYAEVYCFQTTGVTIGLSVNSGTAGFFQGFLARAA